MTYRINAATDKQGLIIVERPHRGGLRIWSAFSEQDALVRTQAAAEQSRADLSDFDLSTFAGAMDWNGHDLSSQTIIRFDDLDDLNDELASIVEEAVRLGWFEEIDEEEAA